MPISLNSLDSHQFELLCAALMAAEGFSKFEPFGGVDFRDRGVDWVCRDPNDQRVVVEAKVVRESVYLTTLRRAVEDVRNGLLLVGADRALLIVSKPLTADIRTHLMDALRAVEIWDGSTVQALLAKHRTVDEQFASLLGVQNRVERLAPKLGAPSPSKDRSESLIEQLERLPPGRDHYRDYERICEEILTYCLVPPLRTPRPQTVSEDGLDRRDLIFSLGNADPFWDQVRYDFGSRVVVVEFKNIQAIGQKEVESLQQYLFPGAMRTFGLLCSRGTPTESAMKARRRAWVLGKVVIAFLTDTDLKDMVNRRSNDIGVTEGIDLQLDGFFVSLAP